MKKGQKKRVGGIGGFYCLLYLTSSLTQMLLLFLQRKVIRNLDDIAL